MFRSPDTRKSLVLVAGASLVLSLGVLGFAALIHKTFSKAEGPPIALTELNESSGHPSMSQDLPRFELGREKIVPEYNVYSSRGKAAETYTYSIGGKELILAGRYGIPDNAAYNGQIRIAIDGKTIFASSANDQERGATLFRNPDPKGK